MIMPPPKPWRIRKPISDSALHARPESIEPHTKRKIEVEVQTLRAEAVGGPAGERDTVASASV